MADIMEHPYLEDKTLYQAMKKSALEAPNVKAVYYQGKIIRYKKFLKLVDETADILYNVLGVRKDDVVLIAQPNIPEVLLLFYAVNKIGAVSNLVHPFTPYNQVIAIMEKTKSKIAFLFEQRIAKEVTKYREMAGKIYVTRVENYLPPMMKFVYHNFMNNKIRKKLGKARKFDGFKYFHDLKPTGKPVPENTDYAKLSVLLHSGSTTGDPKTIALSDIPFNYIAEYTTEYIGYTMEQLVGKKMLSVLPSFHGFGLEVTMHFPLVNKMACVLVPKFSSKEVAKILNKTPVEAFAGVPTMYEKLFQDEAFLKSKHFKDILACYCGGDACNTTSRHKMDELFAKGGSTSKIYEGYGLTEAVAVNILNRPGHYKDNSIGYPIPEAEFKIVDEQGNEVPRGTIGEIIFKSKGVMLGYYKDEEATKKCLKDGWLYTGDLGHMDEEGYVFFKSRAKRVVKVSGVAVFPSEVERLIETIPGVKKVSAISIPDPQLQSALKVFVVANCVDETEMKSKIMETCRKYLVRWSLPKEIEFRDELPITQLGKVDFKVLQKEEDEKRKAN